MILITGSLAFDYLMDYDDEFQKSLLKNDLDKLSVSFLTHNFRKFYGGTAGNIAHGLKMSGGSPLIFATAGYDFEGYQSSLDWKGISTKNITVLDDEVTASCFITTDTKENQINFFHPGAMFKAAKEELTPYKDKIDYAIISPEAVETMIHYAGQCQQNNISYFFDPGQNTGLFSKEDFKKVLIGAKGLFCNDYEWELIQQKLEISGKEIRELIEVLVLTLGEKGSKIITKDQEIKIPIIKPQQIKDPTGCGDAFRGGFLTALSNGKSDEEAGYWGALNATYCIESGGPQDYKYTKEEFMERLGA